MFQKVLTRGKMLKKDKNYEDHLLKVLSSQRFLNKQGLGNEVPFFICPYDASRENEIKDITKRVIKKLREQNIIVLEISLYDLSIEILKSRGIFEDIINNEKKYHKDELKELLQNVLDSESHLIPAIKDKMEQSKFDVLLITGVGEVFPYIRSHNVLHNLQSKAKDQPTLMMFSGDYIQSSEQGASLQLFSRLQDDKYYRAFDIFQYEV